MRCMYCDHSESKVVDSRPTEDGLRIRRRRECINCGKRFTTYESIANPTVLVVKKDGRREPFNPEKIRDGLIKACEKRPVGAGDIERTVSDIEKRVYNSLYDEVTSNRIGEWVMTSLMDLDQVAYVRFASVYRQFTDLNSFMDELKQLLSDSK